MKRAMIGLIVATVAAAGCASSKASKAETPTKAVAVEAVRPAEAQIPATPVATAAEVAQPAPPVAVVEPRPEAMAAADEVPGLPAYPGATRTKLETSTVPTIEWARKIKVELEVRDSLENVKAFYERVIKENGWQVAGVSEKGGEVRWKLAKDGAVAEVRIEQKGRKRVEIRLERKDR
ncbi:MAG: hypothetical protein KA072_13755 [Thermoanaerobaculaceae bacterium]|nr:hypothetical protein [Thermoanaerobaculaceae bacterium]MDI9622739.1 hypothetical protein [Acidobacteriota bacterium]NLH10022.1 hypothetical protein [Holophagae bacterium]HPW55949.1 hypothetical protein [Thermoanaerobaculaceae bacterium]